MYTSAYNDVLYIFFIVPYTIMYYRRNAGKPKLVSGRVFESYDRVPCLGIFFFRNIFDPHITERIIFI